jgi:Asp-tRNA(Asn)/Glu-tRNA(Gln) amidotransferase A subunit family amidase
MFAVVTGPDRPRYDIGKAPDFTRTKVSESFEDLLNARIEELEATGATIVHVECKPIDLYNHVAYIQFTPATKTLPVATPKTMTIQQVADGLNVSRWFVSDRIRRGDIKAISLGARKVIPIEEYTRLTTPR